MGRNIPLPLAAPLLALCTQASAQETWTVENSGASVGPLYSVAYGGGQFIATGSGGEYTTSADGQSWAPERFGVTTGDMTGVGFAAGEFLVVGTGGTVLRSPDGEDWSAEPSGTLGFLSSCAYGCGRWVAVGAGGLVITSSTAGQWQAPPTPTTGFLSGIAFGAGQFVAVGQTGLILRSRDASNWTIAASDTGVSLTDICYADGRFVAVGQNGTLLVSTDGGVTWDAKTSGTSAALQAVAAGGGDLVAVGADGTVITSADLEAWNAATSNTPYPLTGAAYGAGRFVAVGGDLLDGTPALISAPASGAPEFAWATTSISAPESAGSITLTARRTSAVGATAVDVLAFDGSTEGAADYALGATTLVFADSQSEATVDLNLVADAELEGFEFLTVELQTPTAGHAIADPAHLCVRIWDDADADGDLLPDAWEITHFTDIAAQDGSGDPDADGNDNARELEDGTTPTDQASAKYRVVVTTTGDGSVELDPSSTGGYDRGTGVTLEAIPDTQISFLGWEGNQGAANNLTNPLEINVNFDLFITAHFGVSLREAVDNDEITFNSSGGEWFGQTPINDDGEDAAEAPQLDSAGSATLSAFVQGPGNLSFRWKCSCAVGVDSLRFVQNFSTQATISGETDWATLSVPLTDGVNMLSWSFTRGVGAPAGDNTAWLDQLAIAYSYDAWRADEFDPAAAADELVSGPGADPDRDGLPNRFEYLFGYPPLRFDGRTGLDSRIVQVGGQLYQEFSYRLRKWRRDGLDARIVTSDDLRNWDPSGIEARVFSEDIQGTNYVVLEAVPLGGHGPQYFYRFGITPTVE